MITLPLSVVSSGVEGGEGEEWKCCYCKPTEFLECLREEYRLVCNEGEDCSRHSDDNDDGSEERRELDEEGEELKLKKTMVGGVQSEGMFW